MKRPTHYGQRTSETRTIGGFWTCKKCGLEESPRMARVNFVAFRNRLDGKPDWRVCSYQHVNQCPRQEERR